MLIKTVRSEKSRATSYLNVTNAGHVGQIKSNWNWGGGWIPCCRAHVVDVLGERNAIHRSPILTKICSRTVQLIRRSLRIFPEVRDSIPTTRGLLRAALHWTQRRWAVKRRYGICRYFPYAMSTQWKQDRPSLIAAFLIYRSVCEIYCRSTTYKSSSDVVTITI